MPRVRFVVLLIVSVFSLLDGAAVAWGQFGDAPGAPQVGFSIGYANIGLTSSAFDSESALRFEPTWSIAPIKPVQQLRVGAGVGASFVIDSSVHSIISHDGTVIVTGSADVPIWFIEPEAYLSWQQPFGEHDDGYIEAGIAGGGSFGFLELRDDVTGFSYHANSQTGYGKAFVRLAGRAGLAMFGVEASYLAGGRMDFGGDAAGDLRQYYVGFFGAIRF